MTTQESQYKKMGDILDTVDEQRELKDPNANPILAHKSDELDDRIKPLIHSLHQYIEKLEKLSTQKQLAPKELGNLQNGINSLEHKAKDGIFKGSLKERVIPRGQATVRELLEKCHDLIHDLIGKLPEGEQTDERNRLQSASTSWKSMMVDSRQGEGEGLSKKDEAMKPGTMNLQDRDKAATQ